MTDGNFWQGAAIGFTVSLLNHVAHNIGDDKPKPKKSGATVYTESDGIGHAYIKVKGKYFSYGRLAPGQTASPIGKGYLLKAGEIWAKNRQAEYPTTTKFFPEADGDKIYQHLNEIWESGKYENFGKSHQQSALQTRQIDTYFLLGNNCTTFTCNALQFGGVNIPTFQSPALLSSFMNHVPISGTVTPVIWRNVGGF